MTLIGKLLAKASHMKTAILSIAGFSLLLCSACHRPADRADSPVTRPATDHSPAASPQAPSTPITSAVFATAVLSPASGSKVQGMVSFFKEDNRVRVEATFTGLAPGKHGFHIHEKGDCSAPDASSAGGHFNPTGQPHGGPEGHTRHVGDFGNLEANEAGNARYSQSFSDLKFEGNASILGKAVIVHEKADDLRSQPSGDAGGRVACGIITKK
jgi:superoxide dismutase, Cu-Zn family